MLTLGMKAMKQNICAICGYVHVGSDHPKVCPACSAGKDAFTIFDSDEPDSDSHMVINSALINHWKFQATAFMPENQPGLD